MPLPKNPLLEEKAKKKSRNKGDLEQISIPKDQVQIPEDQNNDEKKRKKGDLENPSQNVDDLQLQDQFLEVM